MNSKIYNTYIDDFKYINIEKYSIKLFNINFNIINISNIFKIYLEY